MAEITSRLAGKASVCRSDIVEEINVIADGEAWCDIRYCDTMAGWHGEAGFDLNPEFCGTAFGFLLSTDTGQAPRKTMVRIS